MKRSLKHRVIVFFCLSLLLVGWLNQPTTSTPNANPNSTNLLALAHAEPPAAQEPLVIEPTAPEQLKLHGPVSHRNLSVYVITGTAITRREFVKDEPSDSNKDPFQYTSLSEAIQQKWVTVHETGSVNQLSIENRSPDHTVVVLAGSIVKGGKQDRVLSHDLVVPPNSGKIAIDSFCVEQSRWKARGKESTKNFHANSAQVSGKGLRKAVKGGRGQNAVWSEVAKEQSKISKNIQSDVRQNRSPSSFQLAIENRSLQKEIRQYKAKFNQIMKGHSDAVGYAVTINGQFSTADVYATPQLFRLMWDQHLTSAITEAISLLDKQAKTSTGQQAKEESWKQDILEGNPFVRITTKKTAGSNRYTTEQSDHLFRYQCIIDRDKPYVLRASYELREKGETASVAMEDSPVEQRMIQRIPNNPLTPLPRNGNR